MHSVIGIFPDRDAAGKAAESLALPHDRISVVAPQPLEAEDAGIGRALGGALGGALGAATGSSLGAAAASLLLPGVGPVVATGVVAAVLLGAGGAVAGAAAGDKVDHKLETDPTHDPRDVFFYHEALRRGRAVVLALAGSKKEAEAIGRKLAARGGHSIDVIREAWWQDVRENERSRYGGDFAADESDFRRGFEDALDPANRDKPLDAGADASKAYRQGYERGFEYVRSLS